MLAGKFRSCFVIFKSRTVTEPEGKETDTDLKCKNISLCDKKKPDKNIFLSVGH